MQPFWIVVIVTAVVLGVVGWDRADDALATQSALARCAPRRGRLPTSSRLRMARRPGDARLVVARFVFAPTVATRLIAQLEAQGSLTASGETLHLTPGGLWRSP